MSRQTEIIAIGNELLIGDVLDTNTQWLCRRLTGIGGRVVRATMIQDDREAIAGVLHAALERRSEVIVTTGGLGPTADDMTLSAIARALGRPMAESPCAMELVQATYRRLAQAGYVEDDRMTAERQKMGVLPAGAAALVNPVGAAPGVVLREGASTIICLPGVPQELKGIFVESLQLLLTQLYGDGYYAERVIQVNCGDETALAPVVDAVAGAHEQVYVKSRAKAYGPNVRLKITLSACGANRDIVSALLDRAMQQLHAGLDALGIAFGEYEQS
jgi:nicotinamide-nucleotide amidase